MPPKASSATSNFIIGMTALAGSSVFIASGLVNVVLAGSVAVGATIGSLTGSSIIHPHMQALASNVPFNHQRLLLVKSYQYYVQTSRNYWAQLIEHEKKSQERFVCEGNYLAWITPFAPLRFFEVWGVFKEPLKPTELESKHLAELADGLSRILAYSYPLFTPPLSVLALNHALPPSIMLLIMRRILWTRDMESLSS